MPPTIAGRDALWRPRPSDAVSRSSRTVPYAGRRARSLFWRGRPCRHASGKPAAPVSPKAGAANAKLLARGRLLRLLRRQKKVREPLLPYTARSRRRAALAAAPPARWAGESSSLALLPYESVRTAADPCGTLLSFLESAYEAGAALADWDRDALRSSWCPEPAALDDLLGGVS
jgi:hypothetical protein